MSQIKDPLLNHEYDGIREFDNPTPAWWHLIFLGTVVFSFFYFIFYTFSPLAPSIQEKWASRQTAEQEREFAAIGKLEADEATLIRLQGDAGLMNVGQKLYVGTCALCHSKDGGGLVGPNLTDEHYKNVKSLTDIYNVVTNGAANGAMPAWRNQLTDNDRILVSAYVASLRGTKPATAKPPEGDVIPPWPAAAASGSN